MPLSRSTRGPASFRGPDRLVDRRSLRGESGGQIHQVRYLRGGGVGSQSDAVATARVADEHVTGFDHFEDGVTNGGQGGGLLKLAPRSRVRSRRPPGQPLPHQLRNQELPAPRAVEATVHEDKSHVRVCLLVVERRSRAPSTAVAPGRREPAVAGASRPGRPAPAPAPARCPAALRHPPPAQSSLTTIAFDARRTQSHGRCVPGRLDAPLDVDAATAGLYRQSDTVRQASNMAGRARRATSLLENPGSRPGRACRRRGSPMATPCDWNRRRAGPPVAGSGLRLRPLGLAYSA